MRLPGLVCKQVRLVCCVAALVAAQPRTVAQTPTNLDAELDHLASAADTLHSKLPNFECTETVTSRRVRNGKEKWKVQFTASLRATRDQTGDAKEEFHPITLDGKPYNKKNLRLPIYVSGGFAGALDTFSKSKRACYAFTYTEGRINFAGRSGAGASDACGHVDGLIGFALLGTNGEVTHVERTVPAETAKQFRIAPYASVDLVPVELNGQTYPLSSHLVSTWPSGDDDVDHFEATYSACHLFAAKVTLLPGSTVIPDDGVPAPK